MFGSRGKCHEYLPLLRCRTPRNGEGLPGLLGKTVRRSIIPLRLEAICPELLHLRRAAGGRVTGNRRATITNAPVGSGSPVSFLSKRRCSWVSYDSEHQSRSDRNRCHYWILGQSPSAEGRNMADTSALDDLRSKLGWSAVLEGHRRCFLSRDCAQRRTSHRGVSVRATLYGVVLFLNRPVL